MSFKFILSLAICFFVECVHSYVLCLFSYHGKARLNVCCTYNKLSVKIILKSSLNREELQ